jgi:hypothetical protein
MSSSEEANMPEPGSSSHSSEDHLVCPLPLQFELKISDFDVDEDEDEDLAGKTFPIPIGLQWTLRFEKQKLQSTHTP